MVHEQDHKMCTETPILGKPQIYKHTNKLYDSAGSFISI